MVAQNIRKDKIKLSYSTHTGNFKTRFFLLLLIDAIMCEELRAVDS